MGTNWEEIRALYATRDALQAEVHEIQAQIEDLCGNPLSADFYRDTAAGKPDAYVRLRAREFLRDGVMYERLSGEERKAVEEYAARLVAEKATPAVVPFDEAVAAIVEKAAASPEVKAANDLGAILLGVEAR
jgi:hypothetical protein